MKHDKFSKFISPLLGKVHDCYIATIEDDWSSVVPLGETIEERTRQMSEFHFHSEDEHIVDSPTSPSPVTVPTIPSEKS